MKLNTIIVLFLTLIYTATTASGAVSVLVSTDWVNKRLPMITNPNQAKIRLIEVSSRGYKTGHIPGAVHIKWISEVFDPETDYMVPGVAEIQRIIDKLGVNQNTQIVIYDGDDKIHHATRLYWTLRYWNFKNLSIMNGNKSQWVLEKRQLTKKVTRPKKQNYIVRYPPATKVRARYSPHIISALANGNVTIVDSRATAYYTGDITRLSAYVRSGHIPGAISIPTMDAMNGNKFKSISELKKLYSKLAPGRKAILYCDTGVLSSHAWFVVSELLGYKKVRVYDGSMREYANRFDTPLIPGEVEGMFPSTPIQDLQDMVDK